MTIAKMLALPDDRLKLTEYTKNWSNRKSPHIISLITMLDLAYGMLLYRERY